MAITQLSPKVDMYTGFKNFAELKKFCKENGYKPTLVEDYGFGDVVKIGVVSKLLDPMEEAKAEGLEVYSTFEEWAEEEQKRHDSENYWQSLRYGVDYVKSTLEEYDYYETIRKMSACQFAVVYYDKNSEGYVYEIRSKRKTLKYQRVDFVYRSIVAARP